MGDQLYAYRSNSSSSGHGDEDAWKERSYGGDKVCRTNVYDEDGCRRPVVPGHNETYVIQTEVTESFVRPTSNFHGYGAPTAQLPPPMKKVTEQYAAPYGIGRTYADKPHGFSSPTRYNGRNRCPPEVDDFLTGVQIEASRAPAIHSPRSFYGPRGHGPINGRPDDRTNYRDRRADSNYGSGSDDDSDRERDDDRYYYKPNKVATAKTTTTWSEVSSPKAYGHGTAARLPGSPPSHGSGKLGMPTSNIEELVHGLKVTTHEYGTQYGAAPEAVKPYSHAYNSGYGSDGTTKYQQTPEAVKLYSGATAKPYGGYGSDGTTKYRQTPEVVKPYSGEVAKPYSGYGSDGTTKYRQTPEAVKPYSGEVVKPYSEYGSDGTTKYRLTPEAVKPYGGEVAKPYGGYGAREAAKPQGVATKYGGGTNYFASSSSSSSSAMDCYEAAKKYHGKVIRS